MGRPKKVKTEKIEAFQDEIEPKNPISDLCRGNKESKCSHPRSMHYDGLRGHCNTQGCICDSFNR